MTETNTVSPAAPRGCAVVTGGARGIGKAVCEALAARGYNVAVNHSHAGSAEAAAEVAASLRERFGVEAAAIQADVSSFDAAAGLMQAAREQLGDVSVLVNNAGITRDALFLRMKEDDFDRVVAVNLKGAFNCCKAAVPAMCKARRGRIVNMSSISGLHGNVGQVNYAASKFGTSAASDPANSDASKRVMGAMHCFPEYTAFHSASTPVPAGEMAPMPVITTRREPSAFRNSLFSHVTAPNLRQSQLSGR